MPELVTLDFEAWTPDADDQGDARLLDAVNVAPSEGRWRPIRRAVAAHITGGVTGTILGGAVGFRPAGDATVTVGTTDGLWHSTNISFTKVQTGLTSTAWAFAQWGNVMLSLSPEEGLYKTTLSGSSTSAIAAAPVGDCIATFNYFVVIGGADGNGQRVQWCAQGDETDWTPDTATQAGYQDLDEAFGNVVAIVGGQFPTVFQERAIVRMTYLGPPTVWRFDTFPVDIGAVARGSVVQVGGTAFFLGPQGPQVWDGQTASPVAGGVARRWFRDQFDPDDEATVQAAIDWENQYVLWHWGTGGMIYSWPEDRLARVEFGQSFPAIMNAPESESTGVSTPHPTWGDGFRKVAAMNGNGYFCTFSGTTLEATWETGEIGFARDRRAFVSEVWPTTDADEAYASIGTRGQRASDAVTWGAEVAMQANGLCPVSVDGRYHRFKLRIPAATEWTHTRGIGVMAHPSGRI